MLEIDIYIENLPLTRTIWAPNERRRCYCTVWCYPWICGASSE